MNSTNTSNTVNGHKRSRWVGALIAGISIGAAGVLYLLKRAKGATRDENIIDDRGTGQHKASQLLRNLRDRAFDADNGKLALALGRPEEEILAWDNGIELIDGDVVMKARGIAMHRGVNIE